VSGLIDGSGGSLVIDAGSLTLGHAGNTYTGGTKLEAGVFVLAAAGAAGTGPISFAGKAALKIENAALSGHIFASNDIVSFGKHDVLDLTGLKFHAGAKATYHKATHHLTVRSGHVTDTLKLLSPHGTHFAVSNDGHGGTKVTLDPPLHTAAVASLSAHDLGGESVVTDSAGHSGDFLFVG
jgi:autotransporter-associated beta strand protein